MGHIGHAPLNRRSTLLETSRTKTFWSKCECQAFKSTSVKNVFRKQWPTFLFG